MADELRTRLERLADRAPGARPAAALDRLDRARHRRNRTRKVGALVVAALVATGGTVTALLAFDDDGSSRAVGDPSPTASAWTPPEILTVWPENAVTNHATDPSVIQRAVDQGDQELQWRIDPDEVARRFAALILGWSDVTLIERDLETEDAVRAYDMTPCPPDVTCDLEGPGPRVRLIQPETTGEGGIWSVAEVKSSDLAIAGIGDVYSAAAGQIVASPGSWVEYQMRLPEGVNAHVGYVLANGCEVATAFDVGLHSDRHVLQLPTAWERASEACSTTGAGYIFAYAQSSITVPVGDPLVESATFEYPWMSLLPIGIELADDGRSELMCSQVPANEIDVLVRDVSISACASWPAGEAIKLHVRHEDIDVPISLELYPAGGCDRLACQGETATWQAGEMLTGPITTAYDLPLLEPGRYVLLDAVHPHTSSIEINVG